MCFLKIKKNQKQLFQFILKPQSGIHRSCRLLEYLNIFASPHFVSLSVLQSFLLASFSPLSTTLSSHSK